MPIRDRKIKGNIKLITLLLGLPLLTIAFQTNDFSESLRLPSSSSHKHSHNHENTKMALKSRSTFGIHISKQVVEHDPETMVSVIRVNIDFESYINSEEVIVKINIPKGLDLVEGNQESTFNPMAAGQQATHRLTLSGNAMLAAGTFIEVYSVVNGTKLGAVAPVELKSAVRSHLSGADIIKKDIDQKILNQQSIEKKYKIIY